MANIFLKEYNMRMFSFLLRQKNIIYLFSKIIATLLFFGLKSPTPVYQKIPN